VQSKFFKKKEVRTSKIIENDAWEGIFEKNFDLKSV